MVPIKDNIIAQHQANQDPASLGNVYVLPHRNSHGCGNGEKHQIFPGQNLNGPTLGVVDPSMFIVTLVHGTTGFTFPRVYHNYDTFDWHSKSDVKKLTKWRNQLIGRSAHGPIRDSRPQWRESETKSLEHIVKEELKLAGNTMSKINWNSVSQKLNRKNYQSGQISIDRTETAVKLRAYKTLSIMRIMSNASETSSTISGSSDFKDEMSNESSFDNRSEYSAVSSTESRGLSQPTAALSLETAQNGQRKQSYADMATQTDSEEDPWYNPRKCALRKAISVVDFLLKHEADRRAKVAATVECGRGLAIRTHEVAM